MVTNTTAMDCGFFGPELGEGCVCQSSLQIPHAVTVRYMLGLPFSEVPLEDALPRRFTPMASKLVFSVIQDVLFLHVGFSTQTKDFRGSERASPTAGNPREQGDKSSNVSYALASEVTHQYSVVLSW